MTPVLDKSVEDRVFNFIVAYKEAHDGGSPSYREIADGCDLAGPSSVVIVLGRLEDAGRIERPEGAHRTIKIPGGKWVMERRANFRFAGVTA